jgi:hypothetical protein
MKRILFIVVWFFVFVFLFFICSLVGAIALDAAGFESAGEFYMDKLFMPFFVFVMVLGLALGLYGFLPGTRQTNIGADKMRFENKGLKYLVLRIGLLVLLLLASLPIGEAIFWLTNFKALNWIAYPIGILYLFGLGWFANKTSEHVAFEGRSLFTAIKFAFGDLRLRLAFLPVVGNWFISDSGNHNEDKEDGN